MNRIDLDDYIRHRGDTDTYFGFSAADTIVGVTANTTRLTINKTTDSKNQVRDIKFLLSRLKNQWMFVDKLTGKLLKNGRHHLLSNCLDQNLI